MAGTATYIFRSEYLKRKIGMNISLLHGMTGFLEKRNPLLDKAPFISAIVVILTWVLLIVSRSQSDFPLIALIDLQIGGGFFILLSGLVLFTKKRFFQHLLFGMMVVQTLIMGLNSQLFFLGCFWGVVTAYLGFSLYRKGFAATIHEIGASPVVEPQRATEKLSKKGLGICLLIAVVALGVYGRTLTQPGLEENQMCYFATAHQSSYEDGIEKFSRVWEIKPIFHRAPIYVVYAAATAVSSYYDKVSFESAVNGIYGLITSLMIIIGVFLARGRLTGVSGLPWWLMALLGIGFQTVMVVRFFEVEEMVFSLSVLGIGLLLSKRWPLVLLSPFVFLEITLLKGLTLFTPMAYLFFFLLLFRFSKREYIAFGIGSLLAVGTLLLFFKTYPLFMQEYGSARSIQQSTVFFFAIVRILTFFGALAKGMLTNPFLFPGIVVTVLLLQYFGSTKRYRPVAGLILLWSFLGIIPLLMGKSFTYYALPFTIGAFLSILLFIGEYGGILKSLKESGKGKKRVLVAFGIPSLVLLLQFPVQSIAFIIFGGAVIIFLSRKRELTTASMVLGTIFIGTNLSWMATNHAWIERKPAILFHEPLITDFFFDDESLRSETMLYLTFGPEPYHLGLKNSNRYFYTLPFRRHLQMVNAAEGKSKELQLIARFTKESARIIEQTRPVQECLEEALQFQGRFILHSYNSELQKSGWCRRDLYPALDSKIATEYKPLIIGTNHILYERRGVHIEE